MRGETIILIILAYLVVLRFTHWACGFDEEDKE